MSIDSPSARMPRNAPGADNFNYIDTYVEFIAEVVLKYNNAIPETKNRDQKESQMQKQFEMVLQKIDPIELTPLGEELPQATATDANKYAYQFVKEINPPPPKV